MRTAILLIFLAALTSCARPAGAPTSTTPAAPTASAGCAYEATHRVRFSDERTDDVVTATSAGPSCAQAVVVMTIRNSAGDPLWTFAETYNGMTNPGGGVGEAPVSEAQVQSFLDSWTKVTLSRTSSLPDWTDGKSSLAESATGGMYSTPFERETYRALRSRDLAQLCFSNSPESAQCLIIDPASHAPTVIAFMGA